MTDLVQATLAAYESQINFALLTVVGDAIDSGLAIGSRLLLTEKGEVSGSLGGGPIEEQALGQAREAIRLGKSSTQYYGLDGKRLSRRDRAVGIFIEVVLGDLSLVIVGGGHVGQAIGKVASQCGYRIVVVDDRPAFASRERFPEA
ncbi:MAG: XdhC family protein, partial [Chloroflexi bacterium]|nr:XdhC family protein [Chloroflexota bacterium]